MSSNKNESKTMSWLLDKSTDPNFKIDMPGVQTRTKRMVAFDKGLQIKLISVMHDLENNLNYSTNDKRELKGLIDNIFFKDVGAVANVNDLAEATTVGDLVLRIYSNYILEDRKL